MKNNKKKTLLAFLLILITAFIMLGTTYAFFIFTQLGVKENSITVSGVTFTYDEESKKGRGIVLEDAIPQDNDSAKIQTTNVFDFNISSTTPNKTEVPYTVTAKSIDSTLDGSVVNMYLTDKTNTEVFLDMTRYTQLGKYNNNESERIIYQGIVPQNSNGRNSYSKDFRLRMWIDEDTKFSKVDVTKYYCDGTEVSQADYTSCQTNPTTNVVQEYPYNNKTFKIIVNVYAEGEQLTQQKIALRKSPAIRTLKVGLTPLQQTGTDSYETTLPAGTETTSLSVETENPKATVTVTDRDLDQVVNPSNVALEEGDNYFDIEVKPEDQTEPAKDYEINVIVEPVVTLQGLARMIYDDNGGIQNIPVLDSSRLHGISDSTNPGDNGLFRLETPLDPETGTSGFGGGPGTTFYFRGNVTNNYVDFAGFTWRIVRINEDGTVRLIADDSNAKPHEKLNSGGFRIPQMYYSIGTSSSSSRYALQDWYKTNITNKGYGAKVATGNYFCEQAKVAPSEALASGSGADMKLYNDSEYTIDMTCKNDANNHGLVNTNVGLITAEESIYAGQYFMSRNTNTYLYTSNYNIWTTMSPAGVNNSASYSAYDWHFETSSMNMHYYYGVNFGFDLRPVINLVSTVTATKDPNTGHYVVE